MRLTLEQVEHIAELAKLSLTGEEKEDYREQLSAILEYADMLQQLDTSSISPTATVLPLQSVMREDQVAPSFSVEDILANAPEQQDNSFRVRAILGDAGSSA
jgi:aspartyl-tRNA(Asn)/glutamyl-tRNA(Gln) amidotransferase subunit C